jgi:uncharacterized protein with GYD domain
MPTFITLIHFTEQGVRNLKDTAKRADAITKAVKKIGVSIREVFWTLGRFDGVLIFDAPDEETAAATLMTIGRMGNVRSETLRAFGRDEIGGILAKVK